MIWICSLFLLVVAAWFFFNALNERRWVEAHSHDETVASDEGLLSAFSTRTGTGPQSPDGKVSIDQENSRFAKAVQKVQDKTSGYSKKLESKLTEARNDDPAQGPLSASEENTLFGRAVAVVSEKTSKMEESFKGKVQQGMSSRSSGDNGESLFERTRKHVAATSDDVSKRVASGAKNLAGNFSGDGKLGKSAALFSNAGDKVSSGMQKFERKLGDKVASARESDKDIVSRVAEKVGNTMEKMDKKRTTASQSESE